MTRPWTEEEIAAFVDGALDAGRAEEMARIIATDPEAAALAREIEDTNRLVRDAYADVMEAPVPDHLKAVVMETRQTVVPFRPKAAPRAFGWSQLAAAASVAIAVGLAAGIYLGQPGGTLVVAPGDAGPDTPLFAALEHLPSGTRSAKNIVPMLSFRDRGGRYCREFEVIGALPEELEFGIACRIEPARWHVEIVVAAPIIEPGPEGFAPASGPAGDALDAMLDALGGTRPFLPEEEATLLDEGWPVLSD